MKIKFLFAWYDLWIGAYINRKMREVYIFPIPMFGVMVKFGPKFRPFDPSKNAEAIRQMREDLERERKREEGRIKW